VIEREGHARGVALKSDKHDVRSGNGMQGHHYRFKTCLTDADNLKTMREVVNVHVGKAGVQTGEACWEVPLVFAS